MDPAEPDARSRFCGGGGPGDWLCQHKGAVFRDGVLLAKGESSVVPSGTKVRTGPRSVARLLFPGEGRCTIGRRPTEVITRTGLYGSLYTQTSGKSTCKSPGAKKSLFCGDPTVPCSNEMHLRGEARVNITHNESATASLSESYSRSARIVLCAGHLRISTLLEGGGVDEERGRARGKFRWIVELEESFSKVEEPFAEAWSRSASVSAIGYSVGRGTCRSEFERS